MSDASPKHRGRPPTPRRFLPDLGVSRVRSALELWHLAAKALDEGKVTLDEAWRLAGLAEKRVQLVDSEELRKELDELRTRQIEQAKRAALPASKTTVEVGSGSDDA